MAISSDVHSHTCPWVGFHLFLYCPCNTYFLNFFCCTLLQQHLPIVPNFHASHLHSYHYHHHHFLAPTGLWHCHLCCLQIPFCSFLIYFSRVEQGTGTTERQRSGKTLPSFMPYILSIIRRHRPSHQVASTTICIHSTRAAMVPEHHSNVISSTL